jgi:hypothetical protein
MSICKPWCNPDPDGLPDPDAPAAEADVPAAEADGLPDPDAPPEPDGLPDPDGTGEDGGVGTSSSLSS